ncbi:hypothetical protein [Microbacterium sp. GXF7504]
MPYTADQHPRTPSADELRERIPGWGADLDPADRPSSPKEVDMRGSTGAHWERPEQQRPDGYRERSIEHARLPAVFGTAQPLHGVSGAIRRLAYERYSEGRAAHWLLLVLGDRVEMLGALARSTVSGRPDDPITETGILAERGTNPIAARKGRIDTKHAWIDPILAAGPWLLGGVAIVAIVRKAVRGRR